MKQKKPSRETPYYLGIDPGVQSALALLDPTKPIKEQVVRHSIFHKPKKNEPPLDIKIMVKMIQDIIRDVPNIQKRGFVVAIEKQYLDKNPRAMRTLSVGVGKWQAAAELCDALRIEEVWPSSWQSAIGAAGQKREKVKEMSMASVRILYGIELAKKDSDIADAIWIARYLMINETIF